MQPKIKTKIMIPMRERERERERDKIKEKHSLMSDCASMVPLMLHIQKKKKNDEIRGIENRDLEREKSTRKKKRECVNVGVVL